MDERVRENWHTDEVEQRSKHQLIESHFLLYQPLFWQNPTQRHFTNTTCTTDIDAGLIGNLHTHLPGLLDGLDVECVPSISRIQTPPLNKSKLRETWRSFQTSIPSIPNCPPLIVCKSACSPPPEIFAGRTRGIRSSRCSFLVGNALSFRKISFPRQRAACTTQTSKSCIQTLSGTYKNEKIFVTNRGEIAVRVIRTAHEMGVPFVAVYSIYRNVLLVRLANVAVCIGEAPCSQSYPVVVNILSAAVSHGYTMLHPGYGFLSEIVGF